MDFSKKRNLGFLIFAIVLFFVCVKIFSPTDTQNEPKKPQNTAQNSAGSKSVNKNKPKQNVQTQSPSQAQPSGGGLVLPDNIGTVDTSDRTNYIENALDRNGKPLRFYKLPIKVYIQEGEYEYLARNALMEWQNSTGVVSFTYMNYPQNAQIEIKFTSTPLKVYDSGYFQSGYTSYKVNPKTNEIKNSSVVILTEHKGNKLKKEIIYHTLLHEIGHAIGVCGHSDDDNDIMSTANGLSSERLSRKDIETIKLIYSNMDFERNSQMYKSAKYKQIKENLQKIPNDYNAWVQLGDFYFEGEYYDNAFKCFEYLTQLNPNEAIGYSRLGAYYHKMNDFENAYKNFEIAHLKKPSEPIFIFDLAAICYNARKKEKAKPYLENFINANPQYRNEPDFASILKAYGL